MPVEAVVHRIPPPPTPNDEILRALVFDSVFDIYRGVVAYVRVFSGKELCRLLSQHGFQQVRQRGSHAVDHAHRECKRHDKNRRHQTAQPDGIHVRKAAG